MACNDDNIANSFLDIAAAIRLLANSSQNSGCCDDGPTVVNNSIQNFVYQPVGGNPVPVYGSSPPVELGYGEVPEGYPDFAAYDIDKCSKANALINALIVTLRAFAAFELAQFSGLTALTLMAISGALVVGPFVIPALIAGLIVLAAAVHSLDAAADDIDANRVAWVCALYTGNSTEGIIGVIADLLDILIAAIGTTGPISFAVKTVVLILLNTDNLNKLFTSEPMLAGAGVDCSECAWWSCAIGTILASDSNSITLESIDPGDFDQLTAVAYDNGEALVNLAAEVTGWIAPSDHPEFAAAWDTDADMCGAGFGSPWENISAAPEAGPLAARTFQHRGNVVFTVTYTRAT